jgi:hypothetical protein
VVPSLTPAQRSLRGRLAAETSWANTADPSTRTAPARAAFLDRFERQVDPDGILTPVDRARRAEHARKAHFARMALKSAQARRRRAGRTPDDSEAAST